MSFERSVVGQRRGALHLNTALRCVFWLLLLLIVALTIIPPTLRPITRVPHGFEHIGIFMLLGICFSTGYRWRSDAFLALLALIAGLELVQVVIPGRHGRVSDFVENALGLTAGICIVYSVKWLFQRFAYRGFG